MNRSEYSYLDFTVMPFLRRKVISSDAAILFDESVSKVLWANAVGTELFGGSGIFSLLNMELSERHPLVRQLKNAARQITDQVPIERGFRVARGLKSDLMQGELSRISLPNDEEAILLVFEGQGKAAKIREHELAVMAVNALEDFADAAAIVDEYGLVLASSPGFDTLDIEPETLEALIAIVAREDDRLVKRKIETASGRPAAAGLGRIRDVPGRFIIVIADTSDDDKDAQTVAAAPDDADYQPGLLEDTGEGFGPDAFMNKDEAFHTGTSPESYGDYTNYDDETVIPPWLEADDGLTGEADLHQRKLETVEEAQVNEEMSDIPADQTEKAAPLSQDETPSGKQADLRPQLPTRAKNPETGSLLDRWYFSDADMKSDLEKSSSEISGPAENARQSEAGAEPDTGKSNELLDHKDSRDQISVGAHHHGLADEYGSPDLLKENIDVPSRQADILAPVSRDEAAEGPSSFQSNLPQRFAFSVDRFQVVQSVSPDLAKAVGTRSGDILGKHWNMLSRERGFDENDTILRLLEKGDTWSGKSVLWPIDDTDMVVPVDLAALPVFDRERNFDGFRGFGVIRLEDAIIDQNGTGLRLGAAEPANDAPVSDPLGEPEDDGETSPQVWYTHVDGEDADLPVGETKRTDSSEPRRETDISSGANVFRLPQNPHSTARNKNLESAQPEQTKDDQLTGKEQQAFSEISRSLSSAADNDDEKPLTGTMDHSDRKKDRIPPDAFPSNESDEIQQFTGSPQSFVTDALLETLPVPLFVYQTQKTLFANDALLDLTGYGSTEEIAEAGGVDALIGDHDPSEGTDNKGSKLTKKDGRRIDVRSRLTSISWRGEKALCLTFAEIPKAPVEEKATLDLVRVSELENILETAADGILVIDENGKIESLNASGEALFGRSQQDVIGQSFGKLFATESRQALENYIRDLNQPGVSGVMNQGQQVIGLESGGGMIPLFATIGKIGNSSRYCAVLRDLTQWKKNEEELVEAKRNAETANDQKSEFLSRISHEIREPLTAIIGFSDVMIEERFGKIENERYREYLKDINRSGIHVLDLVNDLLDISKIEAGKLELSYEAVDLNQLAAETVALLQPQANNKRILIRTSLSRAVPKVVADARSIRQIILNLVSNAINHSPKNSQVIVSTTYEENSEVGLRIRDTGKGMTAEEIQMALQPFTQVGSGKDGKQTGTGLGLPLTKALIEANRAFFELESTPGEGTIAHIQFPSQRVLAD